MMKAVHLGKSVMLTVVTRVITIAGGLIVSILTARFLGPTGRGEYFYVVTIAATAAQFANVGLPSSNTYLLARHPSRLKDLVANSFWASVCLGGAVSAAMVLGGWFAHSAPLPNSLFALLIAPTSMFFMLASLLLVAMGRVRQFNGFQLLYALILTAFMLVAVLLRAGPRGFLFASSAGGLLSSAAILVYFSRQTVVTMKFNTSVLRNGISYSAKAYCTLLLGFLVLRGNVFLLGRIKGLQQLGYYSIALQVADVLTILPATAAMILFPELVRRSSGQWESTIQNLLRIGGIMGVACIFTALTIRPVTLMALGAAYEPAVKVVLWILPGVFFLSLISIVSQYLAAMGFPISVVLVWAVAFALILFSSALLIPAHAAVGAAISFSVTYGVLFGMIFWLAWNKSRLKVVGGTDQEPPELKTVTETMTIA